MKEEIVEYLSQCSLVEFSHIIKQAIDSRKDTEVIDSGYHTKLMLSEITRELDNDNQWSSWTHALIANEDNTVYDRSWASGNGEPFLQKGTCVSCDVKLASHVKNAICPICGKKAGLT